MQDTSEKSFSSTLRSKDFLPKILGHRNGSFDAMFTAGKLG